MSYGGFIDSPRASGSEDVLLYVIIVAYQLSCRQGSIFVTEHFLLNTFLGGLLLMQLRDNFHIYGTSNRAHNLTTPPPSNLFSSVVLVFSDPPNKEETNQNPPGLAAPRSAAR